MIFSLFILGIIIFSTGAIAFLAKQKTVKQSIIAGENCSGGPEDSQGCTNGGDLRNGCNWICNNASQGTILNQISCCEILAQTGDPSACCFDARRRCTPGQCSAIPEGVRKQGCGQLWEMGLCSANTNPTQPPPTSPPQPIQPPSQPPFVGCVDAGDWLCMCYDKGEYKHDCANYESQPKKDYIAKCGGDAAKAELQWRYDASTWLTGSGSCCGGQNACATNNINPTNEPYVPPTSAPLSYPTSPPYNYLPTSTPTADTSLPGFNFPTYPIQQNQPIALPQNPQNPQTPYFPQLPQFSFPQFNFPKLDLSNLIKPINISEIETLNQNSTRTLDLFEYLFYRVRFYDKLLEDGINKKIIDIFQLVKSK